VPLTQLEADQVLRGVALLRHIPPAGEPMASPLVPLLSVIGIAWHLPQDGAFFDQFWLDQHRWFIRAPFLWAGLLLAVSLWYVARRLYGTAAGHIALALFAFSPGMVACSSLASPQILGAWGAFGLIFTAIATAHTLYAPREVILWNWKRIALLGIAIALAAGAQWTLAWLLVPAAAFMLWAVPHRRGAAMLILLAAACVSLVLLDAVYLASPARLAHGLMHAKWLGFSAPMVPRLPRMLGGFYFDSAPGALLLMLIALPAWLASRRSRFFGNTAPLIIFALLLALGIAMPETGATVTLFASLPFLLLFVSGVFADLIESKWQPMALAVAFAVVAAQAAYSIASLVRMYSRLPGA
jgi:4-amino-4-deoxy-L-arabinose transferase-like glycosyltransferase